MGQSEVIEFLEQYPKRWFTGMEIAQALGTSEDVVYQSVLRLRKSKIIRIKKELRRVTGGLRPVNVYAHKRR